MIQFSVIIPAYNAENHIRKTLDSVKQQTFTNYELIVVCDSCTDNTEAIAKEYGAKTLTVNFHHSGYTRNAGLDIAQGRYVLFMDDDDWWLHEYVFEILNEKLNEGYIAPDILFFSFIFKNVKYHNPEHGEYLPAFWNKCWRRGFIQDIRVEGEDAYEGDVEFQEKALAKNPKIVEWDMPLYYYNYMRPDSMSDKRGC